jgi:hypothetical protein
MDPGAPMRRNETHAVAKFIIQLARRDDSLDAATLRRRAVAEFGSPLMAVLINDS